MPCLITILAESSFARDHHRTASEVDMIPKGGLDLFTGIDLERGDADAVDLDAGRMVLKIKFLRTVWSNILVTEDSLARCVHVGRSAPFRGLHRSAAATPLSGTEMPITSMARTPG